MRARPCRDPKCHAKIIDADLVEVIDGRFVKTGKKIPLDASSPIYAVVDDGEEFEETPRVVREKRAFVTHFRTCTSPSRFSKKGGAS